MAAMQYTVLYSTVPHWPMMYQFDHRDLAAVGTDVNYKSQVIIHWKMIKIEKWTMCGRSTSTVRSGK